MVDIQFLFKSRDEFVNFIRSFKAQGEAFGVEIKISEIPLNSKKKKGGRK